jgi:LacI family transcriptional regulator
VRAVAQEMGYRPNIIARRLQQQCTETIGFVIPTFGPRFSDPFFSELLAGIGNEAAEHEYDLLVSTHAPGPDELLGYERLVTERRVDGLLVVRTRRQDSRIAYLLDQQFPFVAFGRSDLEGEFPYVDVDGEAGMYALTEHLIERGHRCIAYVDAPPDVMFRHYRMQGYRRALEAAGLSYDPALIRRGRLTNASGYQAGQQLLGGEPLPSAIIASNDLMALGIMSAAAERGLQVGKDVAVAGFDDIPLAKLSHPPLTTVQQPIYQIGRRICRMLLRLLQDEPLEEAHVLFESKLVVRESTDFNMAQRR